MASAYPMLVRCARHQLREDHPLYEHLRIRHRRDWPLRPNLLLRTGPDRTPDPRQEHGTLVPMLMLKAG